MVELIFSFGCLGALIVLPILYFGLRNVKRTNESLAQRVGFLEETVAELKRTVLSTGLSLDASTAEAGTAASSLGPDRQPTEDGLASQAANPASVPLTDESSSASQPRTTSQSRTDADTGVAEGISAEQTSGAPSAATGMLKGISATTADPLLDRGFPQNPASVQSGQAPPSGPFSQLSSLFGWFTKMHLMVQIGLLILFIGIAFLIKFVADQGLLSIELRLLISAIFGIGLTAVGWRLRNRVQTYGMALMGGGLAIDYLTTYGAMLYTSLPPSLAFPIFVLLGIVGAGLAILANSQILAFLSIVGAFLAPILASTGDGSHITLFSYYAVINAGILAIAWFKSWRSLNVAGYFFTMVVGLFWGLESYTPELFASTEFFLVLFYLFYVLIAVLFAAKKARDVVGESTTAFALKDAVDVTLVFGNPLVAFSIQSYLMRDVEYGMAISTFVAGIMYAVLGVLFVLRWRGFRPVAESFLFLAGVFIALSVPLTFGLESTSAIWAVMGVAWIWAGGVRNRRWQMIWGGLIQLAAAVTLIRSLDMFTLLDDAAFFNSSYLGAIIISLTAYASGYLLKRSSASNDSDLWLGPLSGCFTMWAHLWWFCSGMLQVFDFVDERNAFTYLSAATLAFIALSAGVTEWIGARLRWSLVRLPSFLLMAALLFIAIIQTGDTDWPFAAGGWYAWPVGLGIAYWALYRWDRFGNMPWFSFNNWVDGKSRQTGFHHVVGLWSIAWLLTRVGGYLVEKWTINDGWIGLALIGTPTLIAWLVMRFGQRLPWPIGGRANLYQRWGAGPLLGAALFMVIGFNTTTGSVSPLPYLPVLNPLDLVQIAFFLAAFSWIGRYADRTKRAGYWIISIAAFIALNAGLARAVHHVLGVPFEFGLLADSSVLQTLYAVSWSVVAMVLMFLSHYKGAGWRSVWTGGAIVLGLTVVKLFAIDLANSGTIARIVSFIATGLLIIIIAYFAPAPPKGEVDAEIGDDDEMVLPDAAVPQG